MRFPGAAALAGVIVATACGGQGAAVGADAERTINVEMNEFRYSPATISVKAGETLTLRFRNSGAVVHEFMAGREPITGVGYKQDWLGLAGAGHSGGHDADHRGGGVRVEPKGTATLTITVPADAGEFEFACFVAGHYEGGMKGTLIVTPAVPTSVPRPAGTGATAQPAATPMRSAMPGGDMDDMGH